MASSHAGARALPGPGTISPAQLRAETLAKLQVEMLAAMAELDRDLAAGGGGAGPRSKPKARRKTGRRPKPIPRD